MAKPPSKYRVRSIQERLDLIRVRENLPSDYKLALFLGIGETALANYRKGRSLPDADAALKISNALGENPGLFLVELEAMRAKTTKAKLAWSAVVGVVAGVANLNPEAFQVGGGGKVDITSAASVTAEGELPVPRAKQYASCKSRAGISHTTPLQLLQRAVASMLSYSPALSAA